MPRSRCARFARSQPPPVCESSLHPRRRTCGSVRRDRCVSIGRRCEYHRAVSISRDIKSAASFCRPASSRRLDRSVSGLLSRTLRPAHIRRMMLRVGGAEKTALLPDTAFGFSRHRLDAWLWDEAAGAGARHVTGGEPNIITVGRSSHVTARRPTLWFQSAFRRACGGCRGTIFRRLDVCGCELR